MQTIYLDISNKGVYPCIYAKQSEVGRRFLAVITDGGVPYNIPHDALLSVWYEGDTDAGNYSSINEKSAFSIDGNKATVELVAQMLLRPGNGELCLSISHGDGGEINSWNIPYCVEYKPGAGSAVPTEYYTALTDAAARAAEKVGLAAEQAIISKDQANLAKGYASESLNHANSSKKHAEESAAAAFNILTPALAEIKSLLIPVGYIFQWDAVADSEVDLSTPEKVAQHFGFGTWEQIKDSFLLAVGDSHGVGEIGGHEQHTLTIDEMPAHTHPVKFKSSFGGSGIYTALRRDDVEDNFDGENDAAMSVGGGQPFSIMPPYKTVFVWKRIA